VLDGILKTYVEENRSADEIIDMGYEASIIRDIMIRNDRTEYKRNQAPPGLKVTTKSSGYDRRCPIAQKYRSP
jgi:NAD+ synthase (glutamine-hydrolysing)